MARVFAVMAALILSKSGRNVPGLKGTRTTWYATYPKTALALLRITQTAGPIGKTGAVSDTTDDVFYLLSAPE